MGTSSTHTRCLEIPAFGRWHLGCKLLYNNGVHLHQDTGFKKYDSDDTPVNLMFGCKMWIDGILQSVFWLCNDSCTPATGPLEHSRNPTSRLTMLRYHLFFSLFCARQHPNRYPLFHLARCFLWHQGSITWTATIPRVSTLQKNNNQNGRKHTL